MSFKFGGEVRAIRLTLTGRGHTYTYSSINNFLINSLQSIQSLEM